MKNIFHTPMTESEFIDYYASNSVLTGKKILSPERAKELIMELMRPVKCTCGHRMCLGWSMQFRAPNMVEYVKQVNDIKRREGL